MMKTKISYPFHLSFIDYPSNDWSVVVFFMGCDLNCKGCQNPNFQNPNYNYKTKEFDLKNFYLELKNSCKENLTDKVVFSGGDPLSKFNVNFTREFLNTYGKEFDICLYTGISEEKIKLLEIKNFKFIKCGIFLEDQKQQSKKTDNFFMLASKNQKIFNNNLECLTVNGVYNFI